MFSNLKELIRKQYVKSKIKSCAFHKENNKGEYVYISSQNRFDSAQDLDIKTRGQNIVYS